MCISMCICIGMFNRYIYKCVCLYVYVYVGICICIGMFNI